LKFIEEREGRERERERRKRTRERLNEAIIPVILALYLRFANGGFLFAQV